MKVERKTAPAAALMKWLTNTNHGGKEEEEEEDAGRRWLKKKEAKALDGGEVEEEL